MNNSTTSTTSKSLVLILSTLSYEDALKAIPISEIIPQAMPGQLEHMATFPNMLDALLWVSNDSVNRIGEHITPKPLSGDLIALYNTHYNFIKASIEFIRDDPGFINADQVLDNITKSIDVLYETFDIDPKLC